MKPKRKELWYVPPPDVREQLSWEIENNAGLKPMFMDRKGLPARLRTDRQRKLYDQRLREATLETATAVDAYLRGIRVNEYLRNLTWARSIKSAPLPPPVRPRKKP